MSVVQDAVQAAMKKAIALSRPSVKAFAGGFGGGTCAAIMRRAGYPAIVWGTIDDVAHSPDEYAVIEFMVEDAKTFGAFFALNQ